MRVLLVEDNARLAGAVSDTLRRAGLTVVVADGVRAADAACLEQAYDVAVVDITLKDGSGLTWCHGQRGAGSSLPILLLTARNEVGDRVAGLDAGADDYLGKPFAVEELLARIRALARRGPHFTESVRTFGPVTIDRQRRVASVGGASLAFTTREFDIVSLLAFREGHVVSREHLLEAVWGEATEGAGASLDVLVARVRRKLAAQGVSGAIKTLRQLGYAWALERSKRASP